MAGCTAKPKERIFTTDLPLPGGGVLHTVTRLRAAIETNDLPTAPTDLTARVPKQSLLTWELEGDDGGVVVFSSGDLRTWQLETNLPTNTVWIRFECDKDRRFFKVGRLDVPQAP
jgi:hypothetical protein